MLRSHRTAKLWKDVAEKFQYVSPGPMLGAQAADFGKLDITLPRYQEIKGLHENAAVVHRLDPG